ncbi:MAG: ketoacyl-ACP synthase III [Bacteroidales bacterium]|nr:ketoacyl-ACP synthase III [Bacteroidales bacterium]
MAEAYIFKSCLKNPGRIVENNVLEEQLLLNHGIIERLTGIKQRYYISDAESLQSIATDACEEVIINSGINPADIDLIIFYTEVPPSYRENSVLHKRYYEISAHIQNSLIQKSIDILCECFNMAGSCVVFISALQIATSLIKCGYKKNVLIIGASNNSSFLSPVDKNVFMAFGDGAAATIISSSEKPGLIDFYRMTDGEGFDAGFFEDYNTLIIDRKRVAEFAPLAFKLAVDGILKRTNLKIDDINLLIPHQAGDRIIRKGMELAGVPEDKVYYCLEDYGNTGAPAIQVALSSAIDENRIKRGDLLLLVGFGIGWNYGAALVRY